MGKHAFHVINVTLFGSLGTSSANSFSSVSSKMSSPRFARFREDSNLDRVSVSSENHDERTVPKEHVPRQSLLLQHPPAVPQNDTNVSLCHVQRDSVSLFERKGLQARFLVFPDQDKRTKSEPGRRRHHDSPPPKQQEFCPVSDCQFCESRCPNRTSFKRKRMWTASSSPSASVSIDSNARICETCLNLCFATTRSLQ